MATVPWERIIAPKYLGGIGLGSLKLKNLGLLVKWWWMYSNESEPLCKRVLKSIQKLPLKFLSLSDLLQVKHGPFHDIAIQAQKNS